MPQAHTAKQRRMAEHIEKSYRAAGVDPQTARSRAWATVNKLAGAHHSPPVDPARSLAVGAQRERREHDVTKAVAVTIAADHLREDPHYYDKPRGDRHLSAGAREANLAGVREAAEIIIGNKLFTWVKEDREEVAGDRARAYVASLGFDAAHGHGQDLERAFREGFSNLAALLLGEATCNCKHRRPR